MMTGSNSEFHRTHIQACGWGRRFVFWAAPLIVVLAAALLRIVCWQDRNPHVLIPSPQRWSAPLPSPNAYDDFAHAAGLLRDKNAFDDAEGHLSKKVYTLAEKAALIRENAPALESLRTSLTHRYVQPPLVNVSGGHSYLMGDRPLARLLVLKSRVRQAQGNWMGAAESDLDCIQMGVAIPHGGDLTAMLIGGGIEASGQRQLWLNFPHLNAAQTRAVNTRLQQIIASRQSYADTLRIEKWSTEAYLLALMQHRNWKWELLRSLNFGTEVARFMGTSTESEYWMERVSQLEDLSRLAPYSKQQIIDDYDGYMNNLIVSKRMSFNAPPPEHANPFIQAVAPVYSDAAFRRTKIDTGASLLIASLALHAYKLDHHRSSRDLQQLAPNFLARVTNDSRLKSCGSGLSEQSVDMRHSGCG